MSPDPRMIRAQRYPLHSAVTAGDLPRTRGLLDSQARCQINRKYETSGQTPLHLAASTGCPAMVQMLIDAGAHIDAFDSVKQTPLHYSMTNTRWGVMETLVKAGADLNTRRMKDGWTPLFLACIFGYTYKAKYLVDSGADVLLTDDLGWRPEDWADKYGLPVVSKILKGAPRVVTEISGRKYVEMEKEDKLEVPVEFDEGISKLLAKIEVKRKAKIGEHKKLFLKIEKEKEEEEKRNKAKEKEKLMLEELDLKAQEENERKLNEATANIIGRQNRLQKEKEAQMDVQDESTNIKLNPTKKDKTDHDVNLIKDSKMLEKEESNDCQVSALLSEVVDKPTTHNNQAEEAICYEKQPILVKRIKREIQTQEKSSANLVLNKDSFTIEQSESVSTRKDQTCNDTEIIGKKKEKDSSKIHCTYKLQSDEQDNLINQEETNILQKPCGLTKCLKKEKETNEEVCAEKNKVVNVTINEGGETKDKLKSKLPVAISVEADTDCKTKDGILIICQEQETPLESTAVAVDTCNDLPTTAIDAVFDSKEMSGCKSNIKSKGSEMLPTDSVHLLPGKLSNKVEANSKGITISCKESIRENNVLTDCCNADIAGKVFESERNRKSEEKTLVPDTDKKKLADNKKTRKLIWEVHSDTFIKNPKTIVKKKDLQLDKSNPPSNKTQIFDQTRQPDKLEKFLPQTMEIPAIGTSNKQNNKTTKETHLPSQDTKCQTKDKQLVDNPLDLTSQAQNDLLKVDFRSEDNLQEIKEKDKPVKESLSNTLYDGKQLADKIEKDIKIKEFSNETLLDEKHLSDIPSKFVCSDTTGSKSKEEKDMRKDDCREQNNLPQASEMEKKENPLLRPIYDPTTDAQNQADGSLDLKSSDRTNVEVRNEVVKSEIKNESSRTLGVNSITEILSHKENDGSIHEVGSNLTSQRRGVESLEKSHLTTVLENMEYIKVSDGDYPCIEQKPRNKVLIEMNCSRNEKEESSERKCENHHQEQETQIISADYPETNSEVVQKDISGETSTENHLHKTSPETFTKQETNINGKDQNENENDSSNPNNTTKFDKDVLKSQNNKELSNVQSPNTELREGITSEKAQPNMDDLIQNSDLPKVIEDVEFVNRLKVFNNYRNFGAMYSAKKNFKKAEWAFKNGIKQTAGQPARSKEQLRSILSTEIEFRLDRARSLVAMGMQGDARQECQAVRRIDYHNTDAQHIMGQF